MPPTRRAHPARACCSWTVPISGAADAARWRPASIPLILVIDLGCGSGRWARELNRAGYRVLGVDRSAALLSLARRIAPQSRFLAGSLWQVPLPACQAVTSIGECLNYVSGHPASRHHPAELFARIFAALRPGGVFLFDVAEPSRIPQGGIRTHFTEGRGWAILMEAEGDPQSNTLTRRIVCFRKIGNRYRRSREVHRLHLYRAADLLDALAGAGFQAEPLSGYGRFPFPEGIAGFLARKP